MDTEIPPPPPSISPLRCTLGFLLVGLAWGFTTPFIRRAAVAFDPASTDEGRGRLWRALSAVSALLRTPAYALPLLLNVSGSVWFFLLVGQAELSLTVPIVNSLAFLFTVLGEWWADGKIITRDTWAGMALVLAGIGLCVHSKTSS